MPIYESKLVKFNFSEKLMRKSKIVNGVIALGMLSLLVSGCSTHIPVKKEPGHLNLESENFKQQEKTKRVVAIVSPVFAKNDESAKVQNTSNVNPYMAMLLAQQGQTSANVNFTQNFANNYAKQLSEAFQSGISAMLSAKGFKLKGPFKNFDDMTYRDKKVIYLAFVPKVDFHINKKGTQRKVERLYVHENGVIQIGGSLVVTMVEPMTGETFIKKRINLSDFNIEEPYVKERQYKEGDGLSIDTALDKATAPKVLRDTTDVALTKAINEFYAKAMKKINLYLDRDEILSYQKDILKLKGLKRF